VDSSCEIDSSVEIGAYTVIGKNVNIDKNTIIGPHVVISSDCEIGKDNKIYQFSSISEIPQDKKFKGENSKLIIGSGNTIREYCTINRGTKAGGNSITSVGDNNWIMAYVHIAHDCLIGNNNVMSNATSLAGHVEIGNNIVLAGYVLVHQFCKIGDYSFAGMGAALNQDLPPYLLATGSFAKTHGLNREGLRRNNFEQITINALHKAYKLIFRSSNNPKNTNELEILSKEYKEVSNLLNFIEKSDRGVIQSSKQE
jgi:UDP-N-acetylglucosamine acyltransferase|tara:strand:+ start:655 stop:1419 length:765 start_codon:yes stop_codon:yes gene_type:complete